MTRLYHIVSFVMILLVIELKRWKCFLTGQALQSLFITISMFIFSYVIYVVKMNFGTWNYEMNFIRAWLLIEVMYFFNWIISGIVFLILSKLVKFHPIVSDEAETENDEDVWNDRQTQDFVVHLKTEFFHFCYMCSLFTQTCIIGFSEFYFIGIFGPRDFTPTKRIIAVITLHRFWTLFSQLVAFHKGEHVRSNQGFLKTMITLIVHVGATVLTIYWYQQGKMLKGQNIYCQLWIKMILVAMCLEPFFFIIRTFVTKKFNEAAHKAGIENFKRVAELEA